MPEPSLLQYSFLVPVAATIAGWFVVAKQTDRREFRKEVREQVKELRTSIDEMRTRSAAYWLENDHEKAPAAAIALKAEEQRLGRLTRTLVSSGLAFDEAAHRAEIRKLATGGDFERKRRKRTSADEERLSDISGALEDLLTDVDVAFYSEFKPPRSGTWLRWVPLAGFLLVQRE